ncbi:MULTISPECIES: sensor histidine kinase [unclassified Microbacterium]|uniref:sensor histidine kinase n=1 Tax=unclassified Microbacterium TaxID=2609290 RepID=UPI00386E4FE9
MAENTSAPADDRLLSSTRAAAALAATVFVATVIQALSTPTIALLEQAGPWPLPVSIPVAYVLIVAGCAVQAGALMAADRRPRTAVVIVTVVYLALALGLGVPSWLTGMYLVMAVALFLLASRTRTLTAVAWLLASVIGTMAALLWYLLSIGSTLTASLGYVSAEAAGLGAPTAAGTALGVWWSANMTRTRRARDAAERATREHDARVASAQQQERSRIAQELHDVAGQHLAGVITLADAALKIAPTQRDRALTLLEDVRDEGRFAAASLAGALLDLRATGAAAGDDAHDLLRLDDLVGYWRRTGATVEVDVTGDVRSLPAVVSATAYRCVQEALTNAAKHAPGSAVRIALVVGADTFRGTVVNSASTTGDPLPGIGLGWGLRGMQERVELLRGSLATRIPEGGGWELSMEIPLVPAADAGEFREQFA